ncbi:MAG: dicarboxylate/amino acid:cation symporter [Fibrella sp.]|nr:dicarboxylate/amino acid:cation symporter [Armatimonadota bacterium]
MTPDNSSPDTDAVPPKPGGIPLYLRIVIALVLGVIVGVVAQQLTAATGDGKYVEWVGSLEEPAKLIVRCLAALAPALVLVAVVNALLHAEVKGPLAGRLVGLLILNTCVAIVIGLTVANIIHPGRVGALKPPEVVLKASEKASDPEEKRILQIVEKGGFEPVKAKKSDPLKQFLDNVPRSLFGPLSDGGSVLSVILIALAFGFALRPLKDREVRSVSDAVQIAFDALLAVLHYVIVVVPFGVFGIVASLVGTRGFAPFQALGLFILAVLIALLLQAVWYLTRVRFGSWVPPLVLLRGCRDALVTAFSTASSTATMPLTYEALKTRVGLRTRSAGLGALVGANFNNDGTALYEAMSALFIAQAIGRNLNPWEQFLVVLTSIAASVGAAGIPEAGLVTMTLVFTAVGLPVEYIPLLLTVDWFLDRCRTAINVMGDMNVSCLLDGKTRETAEERAIADSV